jgi:hypothetical protein
MPRHFIIAVFLVAVFFAAPAYADGIDLSYFTRVSEQPE